MAEPLRDHRPAVAEPLRNHWPAVAASLAAGTPFLGCDFDGTLAPLALVPEAAILPPAVRGLLAALADPADPPARVAIVSGRALADLRERVGLPELDYVGNHGFEAVGPDFAFRAPVSPELPVRVAAVIREVADRLRHVPGVLTEDKSYTGAVHDRLVPSELRGEVAAAVEEAIAPHADVLFVAPGHRVREIRPRTDRTKGTAVLELLARRGIPTGRAIYLGDDRTDEDAFAALPDGVTIKVGGPDLPTRARYRVDDPAEVADFLERLLRLLRPAAAVRP